METFVIYIAKTGVLLLILYLIFWVFLKKETYFSINRFYLIGSILFSFILPLISVPAFNYSSGQFSAILDEYVVKANGISSTNSDNQAWMQFFVILYFIGVLVLLIRLCAALILLHKIKKQFGFSTESGLKIVTTDKTYTPFSFFKTVFITQGVDESGFKKIFMHELIHVKQWHSADVILLELVTIVQWFNPIVWLYRSSIREIHEYLADEGTLNEGVERTEYQNLLLSLCIGTAPGNIANNFNKSLIKKRIIMMTKNKSGVLSRFKPIIAMPVAILMFLIFSCGNSSLQNKSKDVIDGMKKDVTTTETTQEIDSKVYEEVDVQPEFPGGNEAMFAYISQNVKYPKNAKEKGLQGKVFISFTIDENGNVCNAEVAKGIDEELDAEALRVVNSFPKWKPGTNEGKNVKVKMTLPFQFKLT